MKQRIDSEKIIKPKKLLSLGISLGINERKLFNVLIHHLCYRIIKDQVKLKRKTTVEINVSKIFIHSYLDKDKKRFRLSQVLKSLNNKTYRMKEIESITMDNDSVTMRVKNEYGFNLKSDDIFEMDAEVHRNLRKKSSLVVYEIIQSKIHKLLDENNYIAYQNTEKKRNKIIVIDYYTSIKQLGKRYASVPPSEVVRTVFRTGADELNTLSLGYKIDTNDVGTITKGKTVESFRLLVKFNNEFIS